MQVLVIDGFEVFGNASEDGRGASYHVAYASRMSVAQEIAKGKGCMGGAGSISKVKKAIKVYDSIEEYKSEQEEQIKVAALAKLSDEEKRALGLIK